MKIQLQLQLQLQLEVRHTVSASRMNASARIQWRIIERHFLHFKDLGPSFRDMMVKTRSDDYQIKYIRWWNIKRQLDEIC